MYSKNESMPAPVPETGDIQCWRADNCQFREDTWEEIRSRSTMAAYSRLLMERLRCSASARVAQRVAAPERCPLTTLIVLPSSESADRRFHREKRAFRASC